MRSSGSPTMSRKRRSCPRLPIEPKKVTGSRVMRKPTLQFATRPMRRLMDARWALCLAGLFVVSGVAQNAPPHGGMLPQPTGQRSLDGLEPNGPDGSVEQEKHL